jgi:putative drug exporter of the RND superfamily
VSLLGFSYALDLDASVVNVVTVLGLGLSIDYGLLLVSRFREELRAQPEESVEAAVGRTLARAGRTVVFSAVTVAISLSGLLLFEADILRAVGAAGVSIVAVALLVTLTLVPALLALAGRALVRPGGVSRLPGLRPVLARFGDIAPEEGAFSAFARQVQRRPLAVLLAGTAVLLLLAVPVTRMELRASGVELLPPSAPARVFFETLGERFPATRPATAVVVADAPPEDVAAWAQQVRGLDGVSAVDPVQQRGDYAVLSVRTAGDPVGEQARELVEQLRAQQPGFRTWVTGQAAGQLDFTTALVERAPLAAGVVAGATLVLLFLMTGSVLVPLKALVMNVVSLGASLGVLVWVFQDGHLEGLLGFTSAGGVESFVPPLVLALGFGLAMDYEVFLLARIKEARDAGWSDDEAVVHGLQRSGRIITSAALIIVIVFGGFVAGDLLVIKQTGVALAVAVLIDASVVRCVLVPATMTLLGRWNWWAPRPLRELHARAGLQETWSS